MQNQPHRGYGISSLTYHKRDSSKHEERCSHSTKKQPLQGPENKMKTNKRTENNNNTQKKPLVARPQNWKQLHALWLVSDFARINTCCHNSDDANRHTSRQTRQTNRRLDNVKKDKQIHFNSLKIALPPVQRKNMCREFQT